MKKWIILTALAVATLTAGAQNWYQFGFKVGSQFAITREYSPDTHLNSLRSLYFHGYFRAGEYVFGEIGFGYQYFKDRLAVTNSDGKVIEDLVETRHLVIPIKVVGDVPITKKISFQPQVGIFYLPLIHVTDNLLGCDKTNIENHMTLLTAGFDFRFGFITVGVDYRYSFHHFFKNDEGEHPQCIGISAGVIF